MSHLSHDIHAQELLARSLVEELAAHAATVQELHRTSWESPAGAAFRRALDTLTRRIQGCRAEADELAHALADHAQDVSAHEAAIAHALAQVPTWARELTGSGVHWATEEMGTLLDDAGRGAKELVRDVGTAADVAGKALGAIGRAGRTPFDVGVLW